jgi:hypothetical protein
MASKKTIAPGERVPVTFTEEGHAFILAETLIDDDLTEPLRAATASRGRVTVRLTLDDLEELEGFVAEAANHAGDRAVEARFDRILESLGAELARYEEVDWGAGSHGAAPARDA